MTKQKPHQPKIETEDRVLRGRVKSPLVILQRDIKFVAYLMQLAKVMERRDVGRLLLQHLIERADSFLLFPQFLKRLSLHKQQRHCAAMQIDRLFGVSKRLPKTARTHKAIGGDYLQGRILGVLFLELFDFGKGRDRFTRVQLSKNGVQCLFGRGR